MKKELSLVFLIIISLSSLSFVYAENRVGQECHYLYNGNSITEIQKGIDLARTTLSACKDDNCRNVMNDRIKNYEAQKAARGTKILTDSEKKEMAEKFCGTCLDCVKKIVTGGGYQGEEIKCDFLPKNTVDTCETDWFCDGQGKCTTNKCHITDVYWWADENVINSGAVFARGGKITCVVETEKCFENSEENRKLEIKVFSNLPDKIEGVNILKKSVTRELPITKDNPAVLLEFPAQILASLSKDGTSSEMPYDKLMCQANLYGDSKIVKSDEIEIRVPCTLEDFEFLWDCKTDKLSAKATFEGGCGDKAEVTLRKKAPPSDIVGTIIQTVVFFPLRIIGVTSENANRAEGMTIISGENVDRAIRRIIAQRKGISVNIAGNPGTQIEARIPTSPCPTKGNCKESPGNCKRECDSNGNKLETPKEVTTDAPECMSCINVYCHKTAGSGIKGLIAPRWLPYPNDKLSCEIKDSSGNLQYGICKAGKCIAQDADTKCTKTSCKNVCGKNTEGLDTLQQYGCYKKTGKCMASGAPEIRSKEDRCVDGAWVISRRTFETSIKIPIIGGDLVSTANTALNDFLFLGVSLPLKFLTRDEKGITSYYLKFKYKVPVPFIGGSLYEDKYCSVLRQNKII